MRKIINSAFVSLDGVTEDPSSWATFDPDSGEEAAQALQALDGMLMGRGTDEHFADVMPSQTGLYADAFNAIRKYVFSSTLESADWNNSTIIREDVVAAVTKLKQEDGGDLMIRIRPTQPNPVRASPGRRDPVLRSPGTRRADAPAEARRHDPVAERRRRAHLRACLQLSGKTRRGHRPAGSQPHPRGEVGETRFASAAVLRGASFRRPLRADTAGRGACFACPSGSPIVEDLVPALDDELEPSPDARRCLLADGKRRPRR